VHLAARDRTGVAIAKSKTPLVRVDELGDQISGNAWRAFHISRKGYPRAEGMPVICWRCPSHVQRILTLTFLP